MARLTFPQVWQKIGGLEGETFQTANGRPFTYRFGKTYVVVEPGSTSIPRTFFEKIFQRLGQGTAETAPALQGQTFILRILTDPRINAG